MRPTDKGLSTNPIDLADVPTISVMLNRGPGEVSTRVKLLDAVIGQDAPGFAELDQRLMSIRSHPANLKMPGEINAQGDVPHADVVRCLDSFMKAGINEVEFVGAPAPGRE